MRWLCDGALSVFLAFLLLWDQQPPAVASRPKLIEFGWDTPAPSYVAQHIREMERLPFDGIIMRVPKIHDIFSPNPWTEADIAGELAALKQVQWKQFTDNFVVMNVRSSLDWYDSRQWRSVLSNVALCARVAKAGHCKGVCFDLEPYGKLNPWDYRLQPRRADHSFDEYRARARRCGVEWMTAIQQEFPEPVIFTFFLTTYLNHVARLRDAEARMTTLGSEEYGLLPAFMDGMLEAAQPKTVIIDGNEGSYYYTSQLEYYQAYYRIHQSNRTLIAPDLQEKYLAQVQCAQALYVDRLFNYEPKRTLSSFMSLGEQQRWFDHNLYYALQSTDKYVWLYSQKMHWWKDETVPPGLAQRIRDIRARFDRGASLGDEIGGVITRARMQSTLNKKE